MKLYISSVRKTTEVDHFKKGRIQGISGIDSTDINVKVAGNDLEHAQTELVKALIGCFDCKPDEIKHGMSDTGEINRVEIVKLENEKGETPSAEELELWEADKIKLLHTTFIMHVEELKEIELLRKVTLTAG